MFRNQTTWAITSYFDPLRSGRRLPAYREFRRRLGVPLVAVELSCGDAFDLGPDDADILVQLRGGSILWQKERLLNIALRSLPDECDTIAWLDSDVVFVRDDWAAAARRGLQDFALVQPFDRLYHLGQHDASEVPNGGRRLDYFDSFAARFVQGTIPEESLVTLGEGERLRFAPGMAWVAARRTLEEHGFYDAAVIGAGDSLLRMAASGRYENSAQAARMAPRERRHYLTWAQRFHGTVQTRISYVEGELLHAWHGDLADRRYRERYVSFNRFDFDPQQDIAQTAEGAWRWNSDKPEMHAYVKSHFELLDDAWRRSQSSAGAQAAGSMQ